MRLIGKVDAVSIATPTSTHYEVAKEFLGAGIHSLVEKPITLKLDEADELIAIAREKKCALQVGHIERHNPGFKRVQEIAKNARFLEIHRLGPFTGRINDCGVVLDLTSTPPAVALIARHDRRSRLLWSLPKGHVEEGETPEEAALREVFEETGLVGRIVAPLGVIDFWFVVEDKRIHKTVHHFVIEAIGGELSDEDLEVEAVEWIPFDQVVRKLAYGDERRLVEKVAQIVPGVR